MTAPVASARLIELLRDSRARTLELVVDLKPEQLFGPRLDIVNPLLWEIGHLAWLHEYFILRRVDGRESLLPNADALYNSATVPHDDRWHLPLPSLDGTLEYMSGVQNALTERLKHLGGTPITEHKDGGIPGLFKPAWPAYAPLCAALWSLLVPYLDEFPLRVLPGTRRTT